MKSNWIDRVFIDDQYQHGGMPKRDLSATKDRFHKTALKMLEETDVDHVVYCYIEYDKEGNATLARFYSGLKMDNEEFYKSTGELTGDHYVGAVHKLK